MGHAWKPIEGLPEGWAEWRDSEFPALAEFLENLKRDAPAQAAAAMARVSRDWAIETGMVENLYHWDRGVTETMLDDGFREDRIPRDASGRRKPEEIYLLIEDQRAVVDWLFVFVKGERGFSRSLINEIHAMLVRHQPTYTAYMKLGGQKEALEKELLGGQLKTEPNSVELEDGSRFEYCPVDHAESELDRLVAMYREYETSVPPEILAAWLHHRFVLIHPFPDGNGRVARALASLVLIKGRGFPFIVRTQERNRYFDALETADSGELTRLLDLVKMAQRRELVRIGYVKRTLMRPEPVGASVTGLLDDLARKLVDREQLIPAERLATVTTAAALRDRTFDRLKRLAEEINAKFPPSQGFSASVGNASAHDWIASIPDAAQWAPPSFSQIDLAVILTTTIGQTFRIVCLIHDVSRPFNGVALAQLIVKSDPSTVLNFVPDSSFVYTDRERTEDAIARFDPWLEEQVKRSMRVISESV